METKQVTPADIQAAAKKYSQSLDRGDDCNWHPKSFSEIDYIQGRLDEQNSNHSHLAEQFKKHTEIYCYTQDDLIKFAQWLALKGYVSSFAYLEIAKWSKNHKGKRFSTQQLYELWKQTKEN